jgi:Tfp pilus assembly protein PilN
VSTRQAELDSVKSEIAALPVPVTPRIDTSIVGDEAVRATAVASVLGGRVAWDNVFADLARVLPANVWLQSLAVTAPVGGPGGNLADAATAQAAQAGQPTSVPTAVSIDGFTYAQTDVAKLLARLSTLPSLSRVTLTTSEQSVVQTKNVVHFVIVADLNNAGGAS